MKKYILFLSATLMVSVSWSQTVKNISLTNAADGAAVSVAAGGKKAVVVIFTSHECPYDSYYLERVRQLISQYGDRIAFFQVNANQETEENMDVMKADWLRWRLAVPYLADKDQQLMSALGARKTPEAFVLKPVSGGLQIWYGGAIDDNPQQAGAAKQLYLVDAIEALLNGGSAPVPERAAGCSIRPK